MTSESRDRCQEYEEQLRVEFPGFRIVDKSESFFQRCIHVGLMAVTFGQMREYLSTYHTTLGKTVYVTPDWNDKSADSRYLTLRHEAVHIRQFERFSALGMALLYLLLPLPMGLAYFRARFEKEAYAETVRANAELYGRAHVADPAFREHIIRQFTGPSYGWMWPFRRRLERWYDALLAELAP